MDFDERMTHTIKTSVEDVLERMKSLEAEERYHLLVEWGEYLFCPLAGEEVLQVPDFNSSWKD